MPASEASCPAGISSFFEVCTTDSKGSPLNDPAKIGARGGGFAIGPRVRARVTARARSKTRINIRISSDPTLEASTTRYALENLLKAAGEAMDVSAEIDVRVPIAAGYGTSAAGTAASCLALTDAIQYPVTLNEIGKMTHIAEVVNRTGLGTATALLIGGFVLVTEPGAPGIGNVDRLIFPRDHRIICTHLGPVSTREVLSQTDIVSKVNPLARRAMEKIRRKPDLSTFLSEARRFSKDAGFQTTQISKIIDCMISAGAVGAAQNMLGKAVHGVASSELAARVVRKLRKDFPAAKTFSTRLEDTGVRLI